jgi:hypothetical protein
MRRCKLVDLTVILSSTLDNAQSLVLDSTRQATKCVMGYTLTLDYVKQRLERGDFVQQTDGFNCGPIACLRILELISLVTTQDVRLAYSTNSIWHMVVDQWQLFLSACNRDLLVMFLNVLANESSSEYSSDLEELSKEARRRKNENKWQDTAIAASWASYQEMRHNNQIPEMFKLMSRLKKDITATVACDRNGLRFAPKCDDPCFYRKKECDQQWNKVALDKFK